MLTISDVLIAMTQVNMSRVVESAGLEPPPISVRPILADLMACFGTEVLVVLHEMEQKRADKTYP